MRARSFNSVPTGIITGIIVPVVFLCMVIFLRRDDYQFIEYLRRIYFAGILAKLTSICLIPDLLLFYIYIWTNRNRSAKGVIFSLFVFALFFLVLKVI